MCLRSRLVRNGAILAGLLVISLLIVQYSCGKGFVLERGGKSISPDGTKCCIITYPLSEHYNYITIECVDLEGGYVVMQVKHHLRYALPEIPDIVWADDSSTVSTTYDLGSYGLSGENPFAFSYNFNTNSAKCSAGTIANRDGSELDYGGKIATAMRGLSSAAKRVLRNHEKGKE